MHALGEVALGRDERCRRCSMRELFPANFPILFVQIPNFSMFHEIVQSRWKTTMKKYQANLWNFLSGVEQNLVTQIESKT